MKLLKVLDARCKKKENTPCYFSVRQMLTVGTVFTCNTGFSKIKTLI